MNLGKIGQLGEDIAIKFLEGRGFSSFTRNFYTKFGEIDVSCEKQGITHFYEVKAVSCEITSGNKLKSLNFINPAENLHEKKLSNLGKVIQIYLSKNHIQNWQFGVLLVYIDVITKKALVKFIENVPLPE